MRLSDSNLFSLKDLCLNIVYMYIRNRKLVKFSRSMLGPGVDDISGPSYLKIHTIGKCSLNFIYLIGESVWSKISKHYFEQNLLKVIIIMVL